MAKSALSMSVAREMAGYMRMTPASTSPNDQGAQMSKSMNLMMPVMMGFITWSLASGLALYFIVSNVLGIAQYAMMGNVHWSNLLPKRKAVSTKYAPEVGKTGYMGIRTAPATPTQAVPIPSAR